MVLSILDILRSKEERAMYCPECGGEYREGFTECADCGVPLVESLPAEVPHPDVNLVTVLEAGDPTEVALAESLLLEEKIPYFKKFDQIQDLFALGRFPAGVNPVTGPVRFQVAEEHAEMAIEILQSLKAGYESEPDQAAEPE
jgi:hypothetical protein